MKKKLLTGLAISALSVGLYSGTSMATLVLPGPETSLNQLFDNLGYDIDANTDQIADDDYWSFADPDTGAWAGMMIELAGNATTNTFGIFDTSGIFVELMNGAAKAGDRVALTYEGGALSAVYKVYNTTDGLLYNDFTRSFDNKVFGNTFGFYLGAGVNIFTSDPTKNVGDSPQADHMVSYAGTSTTLGSGLFVNHHILAFEDLASTNNWDQDYNDMVLKVESLTPVPEPTTMLLFGSCLIGLAGISRRRRK